MLIDMKACVSCVQAEYNGALDGSMQEAQQASTMSASLAKTNWINSGLRSQVLLNSPHVQDYHCCSVIHTL